MSWFYPIRRGRAAFADGLRSSTVMTFPIAGKAVGLADPRLLESRDRTRMEALSY
jgi:hypothetical protein